MESQKITLTICSSRLDKEQEKLENRTEADRIMAPDNLMSMPANSWEFDVGLGRFPDDKLSKILAVISEIAKQNSDAWPIDDQWRAVLPNWLKRHLPEPSKQEPDRLLAITPCERWDTLPWEFGSWIDAVRDRGWQWWGYRQVGTSATLVLQIVMLPERIDAFKEIVRAADVVIFAERYKPFNQGLVTSSQTSKAARFS